MIPLLILLGVGVSSKVDSVVVYPDRALVMRKANVRLNGEETLSFPNLPGALLDNSVRISCKDLRIGEVQILKRYEKEPHPKVKKLKAKIDSLKRRDQALSDELDVLKTEEKFLSSISLGTPELISKELVSGKVSPTAWREGLEFMAKELSKIKLRTQRIEKEKKELKEEIDALDRKLKDIRELVENRKEIKVEAYAPKQGLYKVEFSYILPSVIWTPYYELHTLLDESQVELSYYARISQRTGEDWEDTKIVLSTSKPSLARTPPQPFPWWLREREIVERRAKKAAIRERGLAAGAPIEFERKEEALPPPVETGISLQYIIPGRISVKSGEKAKKVPIYETRLPARFEYYIFPKMDAKAYLEAHIENKSDYILLAGEGGGYVGGDFTGKTSLPNLAPEESTSVYFGVDERVKVKRELLKSFTSKTGLIRKRIKRNFLYRNTVENFHSKPIKFTLIDQVPVSQHRDIKVSDISLNPLPTRKDEEKGICYWEMELKPGEKFILDCSFTVEHPVGVTVEGL